MDIKRVSKYLSYILRHHPESAGITLDKNGWGSINDIIENTNRDGKLFISYEILKEVVKSNDKQRFEISEDETKIRANQGHSIAVDLEFVEKTPPQYLYHGTATRFIDSIKKSGLIPMNRQYVHLSKDIETAINVGKRHGKPTILTIKSEEMFNNGAKFYFSKNGVWLVKSVEIEYIVFEK
ncbi:RNA 2'-phosphotransferase [bacterium]|nr:RNA 2'-phosphotransferase [bacterium]